jgi:hypothetical protein
MLERCAPERAHEVKVEQQEQQQQQQQEQQVR